MSSRTTIWVWTRNSLLSDVLAEAVLIKGFAVRHHNHPFTPPPEEAKGNALMVVGPCIGDAEVFLWRKAPPPALLLLRELSMEETAKTDAEPAVTRLPLPLDLTEFHRCLDSCAPLNAI